MLKEDRERRERFVSTKDAKLSGSSTGEGASAFDRHMEPRPLRAGDELYADYMSVAAYSPVDEMDRYGCIYPETAFDMGLAGDGAGWAFTDEETARNYYETGAPSDAVFVEVGKDKTGEYVRPLHPYNEALQVDEYYPPGWAERVGRQRRRKEDPPL